MAKSARTITISGAITIRISKDDYDKWRYNYPKYTNVNYAKAPSQELNEAMAEAFKDKLNKD